MGRLIDCNDVYNVIQITTDNFGVAKKVVEDNMLTMLSKIETVEAIPKADYEARLKADMVEMLEDLRLDFQEAELAGELDNKELIFADEADDLIQQKINELEGEHDPTPQI
jgi:hypothetical protein